MLATLVLLGSASGCSTDQGEAALHARRSALEREVEGLRAAVGKLERGEPILPEDAVVVAVSESIVTEFLGAQLPFEGETDTFTVKLTEGKAVFRGSPGVDLTGSIWRTGQPDLVGKVRARGALEDIEIEPEAGSLRARVALDHVDLVEMGGLEKLIPDVSLNELARTVRKQLEPRLPRLEIPVRIERSVELPTVTSGPVRIQGARMPLEVSVADVLAGDGVLWVAVRVVPGELTKISAEAASSPAPAPVASPTTRERRK